MPRGFFHQSVLTQSKAPSVLVPQCGACGLYKRCKSPKMQVSGKGRKGILIVGEAPGETEDEEGMPFVGKTGKHLEKMLKKFDVDMRKDCWITNSLICHPPKNRKPTPEEIGYCRPNVVRAITDLKPSLILLVGDAATSSVIGWLWKHGGDVGSIGRWRGWKIPSQQLNAWVCPVWHPSFILRDDYGTGKHNEVREAIWHDDLSTAIACHVLNERPWKEVPDYASQIKKCFNPAEAVPILDDMRNRGGTISFDYETNMLKPDSDQARIVSCAVCWEGKETIAYPWHGEAIVATKRLLLSDLFKTAHNLKFEDRWSRAKMDIRIKRWVWCSMNGAHLYDNRPDITGLKFQSFVWTGLGSYDDHIKGLLRASDGSQVNKVISEISLSDLLGYNGLDALVQFHVARKQVEALGWKDLLQNSV